MRCSTAGDCCAVDNGCILAARRGDAAGITWRPAQREPEGREALRECGMAFSFHWELDDLKGAKIHLCADDFAVVILSAKFGREE